MPVMPPYLLRACRIALLVLLAPCMLTPTGPARAQDAAGPHALEEAGFEDYRTPVGRVLTESVARVGTAGLAWRWGAWTRWGRIHFTLVALASAVLVATLFAVGLM